MKTTPKPKKAKYTFEIYVRPMSRGRWYWRCRHRNGNIIADGAEGYSSKAKLWNSLQRFVVGMRTADFVVREV